jgi:regulator of RNase E activity RraA
MSSSLPYLEMLGAIKPGDVLVHQANDESASHLGERSSETAQYRGARGAVSDGGARDTEYLVCLGFPVFARFRTPRDIRGRWRMTAYNVPVVIGGVAISPGDLILGDCDGVLAIPSVVAEEVVSRAEAVVRTESLVRKAVLSGVHPHAAYRQFGRF